MEGQGNRGGRRGNGQPPGGPPPQPGHPQQQPGQAPQPGPPQQSGYPQPDQQQPPAGPSEQLTSGLYVTAEFAYFKLMFIFNGPVITVYGQSVPFKWNKPQVVSLPPGHHPVDIHVPWLSQQCNTARAVVPVHPGYATVLKYSTSYFLFASGKIAPRGFRPWVV